MKIEVTPEMRKKLKLEPATFSGVLDSEPHTPNGGTMLVYICYVPELMRGDKIKVSVEIKELDRGFVMNDEEIDENSEDDILGVFDGYLQNKGDKFFFTDVKPRHPIEWEKTPPFPWFYIAFAGENDKMTNSSEVAPETEKFPIVVGKNEESGEGDKFEIGFVVKKEDGSVLGSTEKWPSLFTGLYSYDTPLELFDLRTQLDSVNLLNVTNYQIKYAPFDGEDIDDLYQATVRSTTTVYDDTIISYNEKKMKAVDAALKKIEKLISSSKNPYFQNIKAVNDYYKKLELYKGEVAQYHHMQKSNIYTQGDCYRLENALIRPLVKELNKLESDVHDYLSMNGKPPKAYKERIDRNIAIITRNKKIDAILSNPAVQIMGLLPGAGVVTGTLKLVKGDIFDGFLDVFGAVINYGSFLKLSRVARAFRKSSKTTVEMLYSYRYRKLVSTITTTDAIDKITETTLKHSGTFLGNLFDTVGTFKSLKGHVDSIAILHRNRDYILDMTQKTIAGINSGFIVNSNSYNRFLLSLKDVNATAEFFAHLRILHAGVKGVKDSYTVTLEAMNDINALLSFKDIPGVSEFDRKIINNTTQMFLLLRERGIEIDTVLSDQTRNFTGNNAILEHFNKSMKQYDLFGINENADVRFKNTRMEMYLALEEIREHWNREKIDRDNYIKERRKSNNSCYDRELMINWANDLKNATTVGLPNSLETKVKNFIMKIEGQIELREALQGKTFVQSLKGAFAAGMTKDKRTGQTDIIFDFDIEYFYEHGENLIKKYY